MLITCIACAVAIQGQAPTMSGAEILAKMKQAVKAAAPIVAEVECKADGFPLNIYEIKLMGPNFLSMVTKTREDGKERVEYEYHNTGKKFFVYQAPEKIYRDEDHPASPVARLLFGLESVITDKYEYEKVQEPKKTFFNGKEAYSIEVVLEGGIECTVFVDPQSYMPLGRTQKFYGAYCRNTFVGDGVSTTTFKKIETHAKLKPSDFEWPLPKDAKTYGEADGG